MISTIVFRYLGTALQFVLLSVIAHSASHDDYGLYVLCLGLTFSYYYLIGLGSSESAMARLARDHGQSLEDRGKIIGSVLVTSLGCVAVLATLSALLFVLSDPSDHSVAAAIFVMLFVSFNGVMFNVSQLLLGAGKSRLGSFFFYPATNLALMFSTVPMALVLRNVTFEQLAIASLTGSALAAFAAVLACYRSAGGLSWSLNEVWTLIRTGFGLTFVRILHVVGFWIPTMVAGFMLSPASAGLIGTAGRLAIAVSAVIAAIRFVIRPAIARALSRNETKNLKRMASSVAFLTTIMGAVAIVLNELFGAKLIGLFFGANFVQIMPILRILLLSVCAEGMFGPVDEILKLAGHQKIVGVIYGLGLVFFLAGTIVATYFDLIWIAWLQVFYVFFIFLAMNIAVRRRLHFFILPSWPDLKLLRKI